MKPIQIIITSILLGATTFAQNPTDKKPNGIATGIIRLPNQPQEIEGEVEQEMKEVTPQPESETKPQLTGEVKLLIPPPIPKTEPKKAEPKAIKLTPGEIVVKEAKLQPKIVEVENTEAAKVVASEPARSGTKTYVIVVEEKAGETLTEKLRNILARDIQVISESPN